MSPARPDSPRVGRSSIANSPNPFATEFEDRLTEPRLERARHYFGRYGAAAFQDAVEADVRIGVLSAGEGDRLLSVLPYLVVDAVLSGGSASTFGAVWQHPFAQTLTSRWWRATRPWATATATAVGARDEVRRHWLLAHYARAERQRYEVSPWLGHALAHTEIRGVTTDLLRLPISALAILIKEARQLRDRLAKLPPGRRRDDARARLRALDPGRRIVLGDRVELAHPPAPGSSREAVVRTLVQGHWKHQPHCPAQSLRKLLWIRPYGRGEDGGATAPGGVHVL